MRTLLQWLLFGLTLAVLWLVSTVLQKADVSAQAIALVTVAVLVLGILVSRRIVARLMPPDPDAPPPKRSRTLLAFVAVLAVLIGYPVFCTLSPGRAVREGMTREQVLAALPRKPNYEYQGSFPLCAASSWRGDCAALQASGAVTFLGWRTGIDTVLVVGLDASGKVVFKGFGDT